MKKRSSKSRKTITWYIYMEIEISINRNRGICKEITITTDLFSDTI